MEDLSELPFEQVLSYLNLKDRLKARTVSRVWRNKFDSYPVNTLCYSQRSSDFIFDKNRWISGVFAANFISSTRFAKFFNTFGQTILSSLKHLRLCDLELSKRDGAKFARILNSFGKLEQLDIIRAELNLPVFKLNLNLPMLTSIQVEGVEGIQKLTLEAPRLRNVKILDCSGRGLRVVEIVHGESVGRLLVDYWEYTEVKKLKNLQYLYFKYNQDIDSTFLSSLPQLKEIYTNYPDVSDLFEQKQRLGRTDLKIYVCGLLLNGPHDPAINAFRSSLSSDLSREWLVILAENRSRLADEIPFYRSLKYSEIESVPSSLEMDLLKSFADLNEVTVFDPVQDIERFLYLLKNFDKIIHLSFYGDQPQDLFNRLPEHSAVQKLFINRLPSDLNFLFRLKHLIHLHIDWPIDSRIIRRAFEELPVLSYFAFTYGQEMASIRISPFKQFHVFVDDMYETQEIVSDLNVAIKLIFRSRSA